MGGLPLLVTALPNLSQCFDGPSDLFVLTVVRAMDRAISLQRCSRSHWDTFILLSAQEEDSFLKTLRQLH